VSPVRPLSVLLLGLGVALAAAGCGQKGPPLAPLRPAPARVEDLAARRLGSLVHLSLTIPDRNLDGSMPADIERVEVYGFAGRPLDARGQPLDAAAWRAMGTLVASVAVQPPPPPGTALPPAAAETPDPDPRPAQGSVALVTEALAATAAASTAPDPREAGGTTGDIEEPLFRPLWPAMVDVPTRSYVAIGISRRGRPGPPSPIVAVPLIPPPPPPGEAPTLTYTATALTVAWPAAARVPKPVQEPAEGLLASRPLVPVPGPYSYNVYEVPARVPEGTVAPPVNAQPLSGLAYEDPRVEFGVARCFAVRTIQAVGSLTIESEPTEAACVTAVDTFPPAAPANLAAVASAGAISLIWEPNIEADLAGYLVLRAEAPGETLQPVTPDPVAETTYRDTDLRPGVRYVYAVVAVDTAEPPNRSPESNRVQETAR
jgi:hypothetical protein